MRIAVYSGSFDPLHIGHLAIMKCLSTSPDFDRTYLVVTPQNPFKKDENLKTALGRLEAARKAVARYPELNVAVDSVEFDMDAPHFTARTLDTLREREPENDFTLVIGGDNLSLFHRWKDYERILLEYGICVYPRTGFDIEALKEEFMRENPDYRITLLENVPIVDVSSTEIRFAQSTGAFDPTSLMM